MFKLLSPAERQAAQAEAEESKQASQEVGKAAQALKQKQLEFEALMQIAPLDFFRLLPEFAGRFDTFDAEGFPLFEDGEALTKSQRKKLAKKLAKHEKSYTKYWAVKNNEQ